MADSLRWMLVVVLLVATVSKVVARAPDPHPARAASGPDRDDIVSSRIARSTGRLGTQGPISSSATAAASGGTVPPAPQSKALMAARTREVTYAKLLQPRSPGDAELWKRGIVVTDIPHFPGPDKTVTYNLRLHVYENGGVKVTAVDTAQCPDQEFFLMTDNEREGELELGMVQAGVASNIVTTCPVQRTSLITVFIEWMKAVKPTMNIYLYDETFKHCLGTGQQMEELEPNDGVPLSALQVLLKGQPYYEKFGFAYPSAPSGPERDKIRSQRVSAYLRNQGGDGSSGSLSRQASSGPLSRHGSSSSLKREGSAATLQHQGSLSSIGSGDFAPLGAELKAVEKVLGSTDAPKYQHLLAKGTVQQLAAFLNERVVFLPQYSTQQAAVAAQADAKRVLCDALTALARSAMHYVDTFVTRPAGTR